MVHLARRDLQFWPDHPPHYARGTKHLSARAREAILLVAKADVLNVVKHPRLHTELHGTRDNRRESLRDEERPRRNLHVVAQLEI